MCGVIGISNCEDVGYALINGFEQLQPRGQDSAGIATWADYKLDVKRGAGLVYELFSGKFFDGRWGIGHVRYPTFGPVKSETDIKRNAQPLFLVDPFPVAMAHNGNIINGHEVAERYPDNPLIHDKRIEVDVKYLLGAFQEKTRRSASLGNGDLFEIVGEIMDEVKGAYSVVALVKDNSGPKIIAFCDPRKIWPLVYGVKGDSIAFASETVALDSLGYDYVADVKAGEVIVVDKNGLDKKQVKAEEPRHCVFEWIYFSRPSSVMEGLPVYEARRRLGLALGEKDTDIDSDVVVGVPNSGLAYAKGYGMAKNIPVSDGFDRNSYVPRSFIAPTQEARRNIVKRKFIPIGSEVKGKRVVITDDSDVRGTTKKQLVTRLRRAGAGAVHNRVGVMIASPCFFGIDISRKGELMLERIMKEYGTDITELQKAVAKELGADTSRWNSPETVAQVIGLPLCMGCLDGRSYACDVSHLLEREGEGRLYELPSKNERVKSNS